MSCHLVRHFHVQHFFSAPDFTPLITVPTTVRGSVVWGHSRRAQPSLMRPTTRSFPLHSFCGSSMPAYCSHQSQNGRCHWRLSIRLMSGWQEVAQSRGRLPRWWHERRMGLVECVEGTTHRTRRDSRRLLPSCPTFLSRTVRPVESTCRYCTVVFSQRSDTDERGDAIYSWLRTSYNFWRPLSFFGSYLHFSVCIDWATYMYVYVKDSTSSTELPITFVLRMTH